LHYEVPPYPCGAYGGQCSPVCGDGRLVGSEIGAAGYCDDGNHVSGDGCSPYCLVECGYVCSGGDESNADTCLTVCGDGVRAGREECDDGNANDGDGCSSSCVVEDGWSCSVPSCRKSQCSSICGDGLRVGREECDDGNGAWYDGCSGYCNVECGFTCTGGGVELRRILVARRAEMG